MKFAASESILALVLIATFWTLASGCFFFHKKSCEEPDPKPVRDCVCSLPKQRGTGNDQSIRVYYSSKSDTCLYFIYSGCGGNGNNFDTMQECINACHPKYQETDCSYFTREITKPKKPSVCLQPMQSGIGCKDLVRVWYNHKTDRCECFGYKGCGGNGNNFETMAECEAKCSPRKPSNRDKCRPKRCSLPADVGCCKAIRFSYYYNAKCDACLIFNYGGCGGNDNRFDTREECERVCKPCI